MFFALLEFARFRPAYTFGALAEEDDGAGAHSGVLPYMILDFYDFGFL